MVERFVDYRHPVQGWTMPLPVEDVQNPPEVFFVKGARLERADLEPPTREAALTLVVARALQRECEPGAWDVLPEHTRALWLMRGGVAVEALRAEGALA